MVASDILEEPWGRVGLAVYYGIVCGLAVHRCFAFIERREVMRDLSALEIATFAGFALVSLGLLKALSTTTDRIAALLYGVFYVVRIATSFAKGSAIDALVGTGAVVISAGMVSVMIGMIRYLMGRSKRSTV